MTEPQITVVQAIGARKEGGAESFYVRFVEALNESKAVNVIPLVAPQSWISRRLASLGIPYETAPFRKWFDWQTSGRISQLAGQQPNTIVQSWMGRASSHVPRLDVPVIARLGGPYKIEYFKRCDHLVVNAPNLIDHVVNNDWPRDRASLIPNFVTEVELPGDEVRVAQRKGLGLAPTDVLLSVFGRLHVNKAFDVAINTLAQLPENVHLQIVGVGPLGEELKELAASNGVLQRTHFRGWVDNVTPLFAATDICLVPSRHEPFGNVVPEAWHHRRAVIASNSLGPASIISDGVDGLLFPIDDPAALAARISRLMTDETLKTNIVEAARRTYEERFAKAIILQMYFDLYRRMLATNLKSQSAR